LNEDHFGKIIAQMNFITCHVPMLSFPFVIGILEKKKSVDDISIVITFQHNESN